MSLLPVDDALARILDGVEPTRIESVALKDAAGRVLAEPLAARRTQPPFAASAMDGYACRAADVANPPTTLKIIGESIAGKRFSGSVEAGEAVRIFTGAPVPDGADTIVIQENTRRDGDRVSVVDGDAERGAFVRAAGLDFAEGDVLLEPGTLLSARHIALAAAMNHARLPVRQRPRVAILATGHELVEPGAEPGPDQIVASNSYGVAAMVEAIGGTALDLGIAIDDRAVISDRLAQARSQSPDVIVTLGGASVGEHDLVQDALADQGFPLDFWKIAMRPGKPLMFSRAKGVRAIGLPGNPVSAMVCARVFLWPLVRALSGVADARSTLTLPLGAALPANGPRQDFMRARRTEDGVVADARQDSSMLAVLARADCLIVRPPHAPPAAKGDPVEALPLDF